MMFIIHSLARLTLFVLIFYSGTLGLSAQETVNLGLSDSRPVLIIYRPTIKNNDTETGVIIFSGGSYGRTSDDTEGIPAAKLLTKNGIAAFVLDYRLPEGKDSLPLADAQKAIRYVRAHAKDYHIKSNKIGIMGFSAGGHLVSTIRTHWENQYDTTSKSISARPDFMILVYPVVSFTDELTHFTTRSNLLGNNMNLETIREFSNELHVANDTPPTFIVHSLDDGLVKVENSLYFEAALRQHHVPVEMFLYAKGGHGFGISNEEDSVQWTESCIKWIRNLH